MDDHLYNYVYLIVLKYFGQFIYCHIHECTYTFMDDHLYDYIYSSV